MKKTIEFTVPGAPQGKARARTVRNNGRTHSYTPRQTKEYEELVRWSYIKQVGGMAFEAGAVHATIAAFFPVPKRASTKKACQMLMGSERPTKKPDADNIAKAVLDALNSVAYSDDAQITMLHVEKRYSTEPHIKVTLSGEVAEG